VALAGPGYQTQSRAATGGPQPLDLRKKRRLGDTLVGIVLFLCGALSILTTISLVIVLLIESSKFFRDPEVTFWAFVSGAVWQPQILKFGVWPLLSATLMVSTIAMFVALPLGLMTAILLSEYAAPNVRATLKPILEILAGVPTVVYGYFALTFMTPTLRAFFGTLGDISMVLVAVVWGGLLLLSIGLIYLGRRVHGAGVGHFLTTLGTLAALTLLLCTLAIVAGLVFGTSIQIYNTAAAGIVVGILVIPLVASMSEDALRAVPMALREAAYGLGGTRLEVVTRVVLPAALSGVTAAFIVAVSRAVGETMIVAIAAGAGPNLTLNPFQSAETITGHINRISGGDLSYNSIDYQSIFALAALLFVMTLMLNVVSRWVMRKFREAY
jgi:phosphate transport system permease protein